MSNYYCYYLICFSDATDVYRDNYLFLSEQYRRSLHSYTVKSLVNEENSYTFLSLYLILFNTSLYEPRKKKKNSLKPLFMPVAKYRKTEFGPGIYPGHSTLFSPIYFLPNSYK